eukprot:gene31008-35314_t
MSGDSDQKKTMEVWHRPLDLSATVDAMLADPAFAAKVDATEVGALGFSLGGYDVLALAGAEQRRLPFAEFCYRESAEKSGTCDWLRRGGVDLSALGPRMEANYRDTRFKAIVAVDPAWVQSFDKASLTRIAVPVQFLNLGTQATTPSIVEAHGLAQTVPGARIARVPDAVHFSFLGLCKPEGAKLLEDMGDDPVCTDAGGRDRAALHEDMLAIILGFLGEALPVSRFCRAGDAAAIRGGGAFMSDVTVGSAATPPGAGAAPTKPAGLPLQFPSVQDLLKAARRGDIALAIGVMTILMVLILPL